MEFCTSRSTDVHIMIRLSNTTSYNMDSKGEQKKKKKKKNHKKNLSVYLGYEISIALPHKSRHVITLHFIKK